MCKIPEEENILMRILKRRHCITQSYKQRPCNALDPKISTGGVKCKLDGGTFSLLKCEVHLLISGSGFGVNLAEKVTKTCPASGRIRFPLLLRLEAFYTNLANDDLARFLQH